MGTPRRRGRRVVLEAPVDAACALDSAAMRWTHCGTCVAAGAVAGEADEWGGAVEAASAAPGAAAAASGVAGAAADMAAGTGALKLLAACPCPGHPCHPSCLHLCGSGQPGC